MAGLNKKSVETAKSSMNGYINAVSGPLSSMKAAIVSLKAHQKVTEDLEDLMQGILGQMKRSKAVDLSDQQSEILEAAIKKWGRTPISMDLTKSDEYTKTALMYLDQAHKGVPKATK
jgi:iron only hydrogenase large subunit-like protein